MKAYVIKGYCRYPEKVFATIEEAKNYALEIIKSEEKRFITNETEWGNKFKTKIKVNDKVVMLSKYVYHSSVNKWWKRTLRRSIIEKDFIGQ